MQNGEPLNTSGLHDGIHKAGPWLPDSSEDAGQGAKVSGAGAESGLGGIDSPLQQPDLDSASL